MSDESSASYLCKQVIVMRKDLGMRKGKMIAQGAHASWAFMIENLDAPGGFSLTDAQSDWVDSSYPKICVGIESETELLRVYQTALGAGLTSHLITDLGLTEFGGVPTKTCCAIGPDWVDEIDAVCGGLKLL